jgi:hypothetical protein
MRDEIGLGVVSRAPTGLRGHGIPIPYWRRDWDKSVFHRHRLRLLSQSGTLRAFQTRKRKRRAAAGVLIGESKRAGQFSELFKVHR